MPLTKNECKFWQCVCVCVSILVREVSAFTRRCPLWWAARRGDPCSCGTAPYTHTAFPAATRKRQPHVICILTLELQQKIYSQIWRRLFIPSSQVCEKRGTYLWGFFEEFSYRKCLKIWPVSPHWSTPRMFPSTFADIAVSQTPTPADHREECGATLWRKIRANIAKKKKRPKWQNKG